MQVRGRIKVNHDKTLEIHGSNFLGENPNQMVTGHCELCNEEVNREFINIKELHLCNIKLSFDGAERLNRNTEWSQNEIDRLTNQIPRIEVIKRHPNAVLPIRKRASDAGYDIHSMVDVIINPGDVVDVDSGLSVVAPFGYYITVEGRSSMYKSGVVPFRGIIDGGYTGSMVISLMNVGNKPYSISKGDRIAQLTIHRLIHADFIEVKEISSKYNIRGNNGFGSSGK